MLEFVEEKLLTEGQRRNIVTLEEAVAAPGVTRAALETLVRRRLVRIEERFGAERVELAHDVLAPIVADGPAGTACTARRAPPRGNGWSRSGARRRSSQRNGGGCAGCYAVAVAGMVLAAVGGVVALRASRTARKQRAGFGRAGRAGVLFEAATLHLWCDVRPRTPPRRLRSRPTCGARLRAALHRCSGSSFRSRQVEHAGAVVSAGLQPGRDARGDGVFDDKTGAACGTREPGRRWARPAAYRPGDSAAFSPDGAAW